jgi:hypothetical protein
MDKFLIAIIGFPLSFIFIIYRAKIKNFTGSVAFAEKYLGAGGTYTLYIILGVVIFILTLMYITGTLQSFLAGTLGPLFFVRQQ